MLSRQGFCYTPSNCCFFSDVTSRLMSRSSEGGAISLPLPQRYDCDCMATPATGGGAIVCLGPSDMNSHTSIHDIF